MRYLLSSSSFLLFLFLFLFFFHGSSTSSSRSLEEEEEEEEEDITISISINNNGNNNEMKSHSLILPIHTNDMELILGNFCEEHNLQYHGCRQLYEVAIHRLIEGQKTYYRKIVENPFYGQPTVKSTSPLVPSPTTTSSSNDDGGDIKVPNEHWSRYQSAFLAEQQLQQGHHHHHHHHSLCQQISIEEEVAWQAILAYLNTTLLPPTTTSSTGKGQKWVFIHSCLLTIEQSPAILIKLIEKLLQNEMMRKEKTTIIILHYGLPITIQISTPSLEREGEESLPIIIYYHVSNLTNFFEIPTINLLHRFSQFMNTHHHSHGHGHGYAKDEILYLHTKGMSYQEEHIEIEDWKDMMLYFLVEQSIACSYLLQSTLFDVIGVNYHSHPRALSGNFWWASVSYLSKLKALDYKVADKYAPERWVLTGREVRLYVPHVSHFDHSHRRYPRYCYASDRSFSSTVTTTLSGDDSSGRSGGGSGSGEGSSQGVPPPTWDEWRIACNNPFIEEYLALYHPHDSSSGSGSGSSGSGSGSGNPPRKLSVRPTGFTLYNT